MCSTASCEIFCLFVYMGRGTHEEPVSWSSIGGNPRCFLFLLPDTLRDFNPVLATVSLAWPK